MRRAPSRSSCCCRSSASSCSSSSTSSSDSSSRGTDPCMGCKTVRSEPGELDPAPSSPAGDDGEQAGHPSPRDVTERRTPTPLVVLLASLTSLGPLSISFYLPALPYLVDEFGVTEAQAQLTMTATLIGLAGGQLILGTVSDSRGRRRLLLLGLASFALVSVAIAVAGNMWLIIGLRVLQGFFASSGIVLSRAIVRDTSARLAVGRINSR